MLIANADHALPLSEQGKKQAEELGKNIEFPIKYFFASDKD